MSSLPLQKVCYPLLRPLGAGYRVFMAVRRAAYRAGRLRVYQSRVPCVSVGNIGWGGSGKTPVVEWLLQWARDAGLHGVVLSRGYKAVPPRLPYEVTPDSDPREAGDEPLMLARRCPWAIVVVDPVRKRAADWAQKMLDPDVFVLDDGFQHLAVARDVDIVLLKQDDLVQEWERVLPSGSWREGAGALKDAHAFCIKATPEEFAALKPLLMRRLGAHGRPVFGFSLISAGLVSVNRQPAEEVADLGGRPYALVSGVADPAQVCVSAQQFLGYPPVEQHIFADHHAFGPDDMRRMARAGVDLVCTPKDAVKLAAQQDVAVWSLMPQTVFHSTLNTDVGTDFNEWWNKRWAALCLGKD